MIRKLLLALTMAGLVAVLIPSSADAADTGTVVFTAGAKVCQDVDNDGCEAGEEADFWAPVAPLSNCTNSQPGLCDEPQDVRYEFSTLIPGHGGASFCAGVAHENGNVQVDDGVNSQCTLSSTGEVLPGPGDIGPYCGYSAGRGISSGNVGNISLDNVGVEWPAAAGGVLPLILTDGSTGEIIGSGAVVTSGANPGTCGLDPSKNFDPTHTFAVSGYANVNRA